MIAIVADELDQGIERLFPEKLGDRAAQRVTADPLIPSDFESRAKPIAATDDGYIQTIDSDGLLDIAKKKELLLRLNYRPGDFVVQGDSLLIVWPAECVQEETGKELNDAIIVGADRSPTQDLKFTIDQLVEVAVRALSTGINDPFTAINCIDRLGAGLCRLAEREIPSAYRYDQNGQLRVIAPPATFTEFLDAAFNQIRQYGRSSVAVTIRLLEILLVVARRVRREADRDALLRHAGMIKRGSSDTLAEEWDRKEVTKRYLAVRACLESEVCPKT